ALAFGSCFFRLGLWQRSLPGSVFEVRKFGRLGRGRRRFWSLLCRHFALESYGFFAKSGSGRQRRNNAVRRPIILSSFGSLIVVVLLLTLARHDRFRDQTGILSHRSLNLAGDVRVFLEKLLGVLASLTNALAVVREPGAGFLHDAGFDAEIDQFAGLGDALAVHDVEFNLFERRSELVLDHLHAGLIADHLVTF